MLSSVRFSKSDRPKLRLRTKSCDSDALSKQIDSMVDWCRARGTAFEELPPIARVDSQLNIFTSLSTASDDASNYASSRPSLYSRRSSSLPASNRYPSSSTALYRNTAEANKSDDEVPTDSAASSGDSGEEGQSDSSSYPSRRSSTTSVATDVGIATSPLKPLQEEPSVDPPSYGEETLQQGPAVPSKEETSISVIPVVTTATNVVNRDKPLPPEPRFDVQAALATLRKERKVTPSRIRSSTADTTTVRNATHVADLYRVNSHSRKVKSSTSLRSRSSLGSLRPKTSWAALRPKTSISSLTSRPRGVSASPSISRIPLAPKCLTDLTRSASLPKPASEPETSTNTEVVDDSAKPNTRRARLGRAVANGRCKVLTIIDEISYEASTIAELPDTEVPRIAELTEPVHEKCSRAFHELADTEKESTEKEMDSAAAQMTADATRDLVSADAAENIIFSIMSQLESVGDLQSTALLSKGFYATFKKHESTLMDRVLYRTSAPACELCTLSNQCVGRAGLRLAAFNQNLKCIRLMKLRIWEHCEARLRLYTLTGLNGSDPVRAAQVENALWRIWTFCRIFGYSSGVSLEEQVDWLNGGAGGREAGAPSSYGMGNMDGLSMAQLEDMTEIWHCLAAVLRDCKRRNAESRKLCAQPDRTADNLADREHNRAEWNFYLRIVGHEAIAVLSSKPQKAEHPTEAGSIVQDEGNFFLTAVERLYQARILAEAVSKAAQYTLPPPKSMHRPSKSNLGAENEAVDSNVPLQPLRIQTNLSKRKPVPLAKDRSIDKATPPTSLQQVFEHKATSEQNRHSTGSAVQSVAITPTASIRIGPTLFPKNTILHSTTADHSAPIPVTLGTAEAPIVDPVDKAMALLVDGMGFSVQASKQALARSDTGYGVDVQAAITMLLNESNSPNKFQVDRQSFHSPQVSVPANITRSGKPVNFRPASIPNRVGSKQQGSPASPRKTNEERNSSSETVDTINSTISGWTSSDDELFPAARSSAVTPMRSYTSGHSRSLSSRTILSPVKALRVLGFNAPPTKGNAGLGIAFPDQLTCSSCDNSPSTTPRGEKRRFTDRLIRVSSSMALVSKLPSLTMSLTTSGASGGTPVSGRSSPRLSFEVGLRTGTRPSKRYTASPDGFLSVEHSPSAQHAGMV